MARNPFNPLPLGGAAERGAYGGGFFSHSTGEMKRLFDEVR
jgi:hypothetical protein